MAKPKPFKSESDLCAAFIRALPRGWTARPETAGWDMLLVRDGDGFQIGVQAKLALNAMVLAQAVEQYRFAATQPGPDCRAVLVPAGETRVGLSYLCPYVGVTVIRMGERRFDPSLPTVKNRWSSEEWYEQAPSSRHELPGYVNDVAAGTPSPSTLTEWKIAALKLNLLMEERGFLTRQDFKDVGIDHRRWIAPGNGWLKLDGKGSYIPGRFYPDFRKKHPAVTEQIKADRGQWQRKADDDPQQLKLIG